MAVGSSHGENFDSLWLYEPATMPFMEKKDTTLAGWYAQNYSNGFPNPKTDYVSTTPGDRQTRAFLLSMLSGQIHSGGIPPELKENSDMGYNDNLDRNGYPKSSQTLIDEAVREAIEAPRRAAEIAKRVAAVTALTAAFAEAATGALFTFTKKHGKDDVSFAAFKTGDNRWSVTGDGRYTNGATYTWDELLSYLTVGSDLAENVQLATAFSPLDASAAPVAKADKS